MVAGLRDVGDKEILRAPVNLAASGDLVALVAGKKIVVVYWHLSTAAATTILFQSGGSTALTGELGTLADDPVEGSYNPDGHFVTVAGEKLNIVVGTGSVDGYICYFEE
jgi:hypothetical protein